MDERAKEAIVLYARYRLEDQLEWFRTRQLEDDAARRQLLQAMSGLYILTFLVSVLALVDAFGLKATWAAFAGVLPALTVPILAYDQLVGFRSRVQSSRDAARALEQLRAVKPGGDAEGEREPSGEDVARYVARLEGVLWQTNERWLK